MRDLTRRILSMKESGMSHAEIAAIVGRSESAISYACKRYGLSGFAAGNENKVLSLQEISNNVERCGFEYVGGYTNKRSIIKVRCKQCGHTFERQYHIFRDVVNGTWNANNECPICRDLLRKQRKKTRQEQRQKEIEREAQKRAQLRAERESREISERLAMRLAIHVCKNCGTEFCREVTGYNSSKYCSEKCQTRFYNRKASEKRYRTLMSREHDNDITLEKLYRKENGVCYLCGMECDWTDGETKDGTFVAGQRYPSIDHVTPVAKGGTHTWNNVRLACRACNTMKRDN